MTRQGLGLGVETKLYSGSASRGRFSCRACFKRGDVLLFKSFGSRLADTTQRCLIALCYSKQ